MVLQLSVHQECQHKDLVHHSNLLEMPGKDSTWGSHPGWAALASQRQL